MDTIEKLKKTIHDHRICLCSFITILLLLLGCFFLRSNFMMIIYSFLVDEEHKNLELVGVVGGFFLFIGSLVTYYKIQHKEQNDFLKLNIEIQHPDCSPTDIMIKTKITNNVNTFKHVKFACLVISRFYTKQQNENQHESIKQVSICKNKIATLDNEFKCDFLESITKVTGCTQKLQYTNDIVRLKNFSALYNQDLEIAFIPLPFYYTENVRFGNEEVSYTFPFDPKEIKLNPGKYSVRFFVFRADCGYHRTVQDVMIIKSI